MPPKRKEVSATTGEQTGRQTRASSRVASSASATAPSTSIASATAPSDSSSRSPDTSSSTDRDTQSAATSSTETSTETQEGAMGGDTARAGPSVPTTRAALTRSAPATGSNSFSDEAFRFVNLVPNDRSPPPDWDTTVDLTSPATPSITRTVFSPIMRRLSESLLQQDQDQGDLTDDFSELTFTSPTTSPPRIPHTLRPLLSNLVDMSPNPPQGEVLQPVTPPHRNNHMDITIDLTDSPAPDASASPEGSSLDPAPGSTSHIRCPVCLDDLPQITSTRRTLMSTVCGHVFCSSCLPLCLRSNGRCPSCRKLLNPNQIHPIFL